MNIYQFCYIFQQIVFSIFTLAITIGVSNSISTNGTCVCAHSRQPVLSAPSNFAHIETYIEAGYCLQSAFPVQDPWISVLYDRHLALETFSAVSSNTCFNHSLKLFPNLVGKGTSFSLFKTHYHNVLHIIIFLCC